MDGQTDPTARCTDSVRRATLHPVARLDDDATKHSKEVIFIVAAAVLHHRTGKKAESLWQ